MADLNYWRLADTDVNEMAPTEGPILEVTMEATGDVLADIQAMHRQAQDLGMKYPVAGLWQSGSHGSEKLEGGEGRFQLHTLVMQVSVQDSELLASYP